MNASDILYRLRIFLLGLSGLVFVGTVAELVLHEHTEGIVQLIPFVLSGLGLAAVLAALLWPRRGTLAGLRAIMVLVMAGSAFGIYEHLANNLAFELEIQPNATAADVFVHALMGASPLLAPGMLAVAALLALAATYYHPTLDSHRESRRPPEPEGRGAP